MKNAHSGIHTFGKPTVNKEDFFGHGVLKRLVSCLETVICGFLSISEL